MTILNPKYPRLSSGDTMKKETTPCLLKNVVAGETNSG